MGIDSGSINISEASGILSNHRGRGDGGNIVLNVRDRISLDDVQASNSGFSSYIFAAGLRGQGKVGMIELSAGSLVIRNGSRITSFSDRTGDTGSIIINARDSIVLDGLAPGSSLSSTIITGVADNGVGQGGNIQITTGALEVRNGAQITSIMLGKGSAGNIAIDARDRIILDGSKRIGENPFRSSIASNALPQREGTGGNSGSITVSTGTLSVTKWCIHLNGRK